MDEGSDSSIWQRLAKIFSNKSADSVEQVIRDASEEGELDKNEGSMLLSVLTLDDMQVQEIMTPRTDIACVNEQATIFDVIQVTISSGHSRIPIYRDTRDNFIGIVHAKDLLRFCLDHQSLQQLATAIMREPFFVPETKKVLDLLHEFQAKKNHLAIVLDEFGGTSGLISIEDVLEEIVGEIEDEYDAPRQEEISLQSDGSYLITGRTYLEDINEKLPLNLTSDEVDTIGGYISLIAGRLPKNNDQFTVDGATFTVIEADARQVHMIRATLTPQE